jgi:hypothetical protein
MRHLLIIMVLALGVANDATAGVWRISRACRWDWIPDCFYVLGRTDLPCYPRLLVWGYSTYQAAPKAYWVLESFTTDYMPAVQFPDVRKTRNWLWVTMRAWRSAYSPEILAGLRWDPTTLAPSYFSSYMTVDSGWMVKWTASEIPFPGDYIYFRARAGNGGFPNFFQYLGYEDGYSDSWTVRVVGYHYFADSNNPVIQTAGVSVITNNCDILNWGFYGENNLSI